ncbi:hypothetical protein [Desulfothermobacter acidiphilus]|uniref:hypothetical protein n=1 Tax=Desulfothermobacter acidiphilus TaxID=1938353 RepID=UPI003F8C3607
MVYQLSFWQVLKAFFVPVDPFIYIVVLGGAIVLPPLLLLGPILRQFKRPPSSRNFRPFIFSELFALGTCALAITILAGTYTGSGVWLKDGVLEIKTGLGAPMAIELKGTRVELVEAGGPWRPVLRTNGLGLPGLSTGYFKFANGKVALYFRHGEPSHEVVLESGGKYYVVAYPGVEKLYQELIARGATPAKL